MANFRTHIGAGIVTSVVIAPVCYFAGYLATMPQMGFAIFLLVVGAILPDIDARNSIPTKILKRILPFFVVGMLIAKTSILIGSNAIEAQIFLCFLVFLGSRYLLPRILLMLTYHRGIVHSVPMGILIFLLMAYWLLSINVNLFLSFVFAGFLAIGFFLHLILDEIYSVDIYNARIKTSFGTALQVFSFSRPLPYLFLYGIIFYVYFYLIRGMV